MVVSNAMEGARAPKQNLLQTATPRRMATGHYRAGTAVLRISRSITVLRFSRSIAVLRISRSITQEHDVAGVG